MYNSIWWIVRPRGGVVEKMELITAGGVCTQTDTIRKSNSALARGKWKYKRLGDKKEATNLYIYLRNTIKCVIIIFWMSSKCENYICERTYTKLNYNNLKNWKLCSNKHKYFLVTFLPYAVFSLRQITIYPRYNLCLFYNNIRATANVSTHLRFYKITWAANSLGFPNTRARVYRENRVKLYMYIVCVSIRFTNLRVRGLSVRIDNNLMDHYENFCPFLIISIIFIRSN